MRTIVRNFLATVRRFKVATLLNILGLTIALAAFILIIIQVRYDQSFNYNIAGSENIFRLELVTDDGKGQAIITRPLSERFFETLPHIQAGALVNGLEGERLISVERLGQDVFLKRSLYQSLLLLLMYFVLIWLKE